jgi:hypothetical protein
MRRVSYVLVRSKTWAKNWICVIPFTLSNTTAYSAVVKCFYIKCCFNRYKIFQLSPIYMQLISYVSVGSQTWAQTLDVFIPFTI